MVTIGRLVNAFFRWEFNSCETLVKAGEVYPIDYANACPDVALTSLHYYFPWAIKALVKWCVFALVTGRRPMLDLDTDRYFAIADEPGISYQDKLAAYRELADAYFETERYQDFCGTSLKRLDQVVLDWVASPDFDQLLVRTVKSVYPAHEHEEFIAHLRGLLDLWVRDESARVEMVVHDRLFPAERRPSWAVTSRRSRSAARTGAGTGTRCGARSTCSPACCVSASSRRTPPRWARRSS